MKQRASKDVFWFHFVVHLLLGTRPGFKSGLYPQWDCIGENWFFLFACGNQLDIASVLRMGLCPLPLSALGHCLCRHCASCHSLPEFIRPALYRRSCFLGLLYPSSPCNLSTSSSAGFCVPWGEGFEGDIPFRNKYSKICLFLSAHCPAVGLWICSHLVQGEASLIMSEHKLIWV